MAIRLKFAFAAVAVLVVGTVLVLSAKGKQAPSSLVAGTGGAMALSCASPSLDGRLPAQVYLPSGYRSSKQRYPVVYFLHGLPAGPQSYTQNAFVADALANAHLKAIVVAPQGARAQDSDQEYLDWSPTDDWPRAITHDLTGCVDHRLRTIANRNGRALIGLSAGGYGSFNIGLRTLDTFAAVESWSGYFVATDPSGHQVLRLRTPAAQRAATVPRGAQLASELAREPSLIAFYVGSADDRFLDMNQAFDASLGRSSITHVFRTYPGGHSAALWQSQAPFWLSMALTALRQDHAH